MRQYWVAPLPPHHIVDGAPYASSATIADVSVAPQKALPANFLEQGVRLEMDAHGQFSNTATPTLILGFYYGGVAGVALAASSAITTTTGATAWPWVMHYEGVIRSVGATGQIVGQGWLQLGTSLTAFATSAIPITAAARTVTIDTTTLKTVTVGATWGTSNAANTLTLGHFNVNIVT